ncbi:unnamed protein product [Prorocentrum cordatum]|uniref:ABC transporter domain-containing protein n=1 Tax=Prorocentrum cordatum TaxID=2364126 RepID=A0ABN9RSA8_9DINO|nr:unnamed protein product [Polarella glacialis]
MPLFVLLCYQNLRHTYPAKGSAAPVRAVRGISLGIRRGECFGLLGPNGAGKTTTLSILTGELWPPTSGKVLVGGEDVSEAGFRVLYRRLGNCPQVDPLWEDLSGRQHLFFHGRVKGVPEAALKTEVEHLLRCLGLSGADANKKAKKYSGGMRRKLSVGIALVGRSEVLLLDEPSAAVDAAAKRYLWQMIKSRGAHQTALLTTHSMEEAEALCDRLTIQVLGRLRCLGSPMHIRNKFGQGYQLELFFKAGVSTEAATRFMDERLSKRAVLAEVHPGRCLYQLPPVDGGPGYMGLAQVFTELSQARHTLGVTEYSLWRPSLEQVFLRFAREQQAADDASAEQPAPEAPCSGAAAPPQEAAV